MAGIRNLGLRDYKWNRERTVRANLRELKMALKRTGDRAWTGIDRHCLWDTDYYLMGYLHEILLWHRDCSRGAPCAPCPKFPDKDMLCGGISDDYEECGGCELDCWIIWKNKLQEMIDMTEEYGELPPNENGKEKWDGLSNRMGKWLKQYFRNLWD
jgi:hypothetical protein